MSLRAILEQDGKQTVKSSLEEAKEEAKAKPAVIWVEYDPSAPTQETVDNLTKALESLQAQNDDLRAVIEGRAAIKAKEEPKPE